MLRSESHATAMTCNENVGNRSTRQKHFCTVQIKIKNHSYPQAHGQLGAPKGAKSFLIRAQIF